MTKIKDLKIVLFDYGNYLGVNKGCLHLRDKKGIEKKYPLLEEMVGEVVLTSGNTVSTGALVSLTYWGIDVLLSTRNGRPLAVLKDLDDDNYVDTRIGRYEATKNFKGHRVAREVLAGKIEGQNVLLHKYGLDADDSLPDTIRTIETLDLKHLREKLRNRRQVREALL